MIRLLIILLLSSSVGNNLYSQTYFPLTGSQQSYLIDWSNPNLITADNDWSNIPYLRGFKGDGLTTNTDIDPRTITLDGTNTAVVIYANQSDPLQILPLHSGLPIPPMPLF